MKRFSFKLFALDFPFFYREYGPEVATTCGRYEARCVHSNRSFDGRSYWAAYWRTERLVRRIYSLNIMTRIDLRSQCPFPIVRRGAGCS
jgi:hypothetical protein